MKCRLCQNTIHSLPIHSFKDMPASAQGMLDESGLSTDHGLSFDLFCCEFCGMIQLDCEPVPYYREVIRATGFTSTMKRVRTEEITGFVNAYGLASKKIIEIGSCRGENLEIIKEAGAVPYGVEFNSENAGLSQAQGYFTAVDFPYGDNLLFDELFDGFVCFNFLEHQPDPLSFVRGIFNNLKDGAVGLVSVPDFDFIIRSNGYYEFISDHLLYFTNETITKLFMLNGFTVLNVAQSNSDTILLTVRKNCAPDLTGLFESQARLTCEIDQFFELNKGKTAIWGASHQSFTLIQMLNLASRVECIIDSAAFKQGKYSPSSHLRIISPSEAQKLDLDNIIIIAPTYSDEIAESIKQNFSREINIASVNNNHLIRK